MGLMKDVEEIDEYHNVLKNNEGKLVVVDFHAQWCGPCKVIAPALKEHAKNLDIIVVKVDVDEAEDIARFEEISAMPTFKFYKNGSKVYEFQGANQEMLNDAINKYK